MVTDPRVFLSGCGRVIRDMVHLIAAAETFAVPQAPFYCDQTVLWQGNIVPVIDIEGWLKGAVTGHEAKYVAIVAYQVQDKIEYGGLSLSIPPGARGVFR